MVVVVAKLLLVGRGRLVARRDGGDDLEENLGGAKLQQPTVVRIKGQRNQHRRNENGHESLLRGIIMMIYCFDERVLLYVVWILV